MIRMVNCPHKINVPNDDGTQKLQDRRQLITILMKSESDF